MMCLSRIISSLNTVHHILEIRRLDPSTKLQLTNLVNTEAKNKNDSISYVKCVQWNLNRYQFTFKARDAAPRGLFHMRKTKEIPQKNNE